MILDVVGLNAMAQGDRDVQEAVAGYLAVIVQLLSRVQLYGTPRTAALQASLSFTNSWSLFRLMCIESCHGAWGETSRRAPEGTRLSPGKGCIPASQLSSLVLSTDPLPLPWMLQEVELRLLGEAACQCLYSRPGPFNLTFQLVPGMLCAGYREGRRDTCQVRGGACTCLQGQAEP